MFLLIISSNPTPAADRILDLPVWPRFESQSLLYLDIDNNVTVKANPKHYSEVKPIYYQYQEAPFYVY